MGTLAMAFFPTQFSGEAAQYELGMHRLARMLGPAWGLEWVELEYRRPEANAAKVAEARPDFVLLHTHRNQVSDGLAFANAFGELAPHVPVALCGWPAHPPYVDGVAAAIGGLTSPSFGLVCGEVEAVMPAVIERVGLGARPGELAGLEGLATWDPAERLWRGSRRYAYVEVLDALPDASIEHIHKAWADGKAGWLELARGCRYRCSFCLACAFERPSLRRFGPDRIGDNVRLAAERGVKVLGLLSASNSFDLPLLRSVVEALRQYGTADMQVAGPVHAKYVHTEALELLGSLSWALMTIGLQTISTGAQRLIRRGDDPEQFATAVERVGAFTTPEVEIILGLPGDSPDGFRKTVELLLSLPVNITVHTLRLDPWSTFLIEHEAHGIRADFSQSAKVIDQPSFSSEAMDECRGWLRAIGRAPWRHRARQLALDGEHLNTTLGAPGGPGPAAYGDPNRPAPRT
jgi:hypothetical protein